MRNKQFILSLSILLTIALCTGDATAGTLKTHGVFSSNMVIQRDKPITIWGWAKPGHMVSVRFGRAESEATASREAGRWEVTFSARQADATRRKLTVTASDETIEMDNILIGDVWVMNGQNNMAFGLGVKRLLADKAVVVKQLGNAEHTRTGVKRLDEWLADGKWDVIHFNWGLWDLAYRNPKSKNFGHLDKVDGKLTTSPADYEENLRTLVARLNKTDATLVWASTTPVPDGEPGRIKGHEVKYNAVAAKSMQENDIAIDDLHAEVVRQGRPRSNNVHDAGDLSGKVAESILAALASRGTAATPDKKPPGTKKSVKELQEDFRKLNFGMFIHYNMATYKGVQWVQRYADPSTFSPGVDSIDTDAWADAAVSAGMTYGVLTVKHVGGFCLWDSKHTAYDVMHPDCPYKKDLVAQFIKSFKSRGLKVGLYYCWRHPGFGEPEKFKVLPPECDPATHTLKEQNEFQKAQIAELLTKYPDVFYIWNDALDDKVMPADEILTHIRSIRPNVIASANWWSWGKKGTPYVDIAVKELRHFPETNTVPGETCWCLEQKWFWKEGAHSKTVRQVVDLMTTANSRNSNFLLNVGPDRDGKIVESSIRTLADIGTLRAPNAIPDLPNGR